MMILSKSVKEISEKTGLPTEKIKSAIYRWATPLTEKGVIVRLEIKRWRGTKRILPEDIGIDDSDTNWNNFKEYIDLGVKNLLDKKTNNKINSIENKARKLLKEYSFNTVWGSFVPCTVFAEWQEKNNKIKKEYFDLAEKLEKNFENIKNKVLEDYKIYCLKLWKDYPNNKKKFETYNDYEKYFINKISSEFISKDKFFDSFKYSSFFYFIPMPSEIEKDVYEADQIKGERELYNHEKEMRKRLSEDMNLKKEEYLESFLESTIGHIRNTILTIVREVRYSIESNQSNELKKGPNRKKLLNMIENFKSLNFYNDNEIEKSLNKLKKDLNKKIDIRSNKEIENTLKEIEFFAKSEFNELVFNNIDFLEI